MLVAQSLRDEAKAPNDGAQEKKDDIGKALFGTFMFIRIRCMQISFRHKTAMLFCYGHGLLTMPKPMN